MKKLFLGVALAATALMTACTIILLWAGMIYLLKQMFWS